MQKKQIPKILLFLAISFLGAIFVFDTYRNFENDKSIDVLNVSRSIAAIFPKEDLAGLDINSSDIGKPQYKALKNTLKAIIQVNQDAKFAYLFAERNGKIYFMADSEQEGSKDYSPPGQEYTEAKTEDRLPFLDGQEHRTGPTTDRWGTWISTLTPIKDEFTGKVIAVLGIDYNTRSWNWGLLLEVTESIVLVLLFLLTVLFLFKVRARNKSLALEIVEHNISTSELRKNEELFRAVVNNSEDLNTLTNENDILLFASSQFEEILGFSGEKYLGQKMRYNIFPDDAQLALSLWSKLKEGGTEVKNYEYRIIDGKNSVRWVSHSAKRVFVNGKVLGYLSTIRDITDHITAKMTLQKSEELFRNITEQMADVVFTTDSAGLITYISPVTSHMFGISPHEMIGRHFMGFVDKGDREHALQEFGKSIGSGSRVGTIEILMKRNDNSSFIGELSSKVFYRDDQVLGTMGIIRDITDRKGAENRINLSIKILSLLNTSTPFRETIELIISYIQNAFGIEAIGIRFKDGNDYPYFAQNGFSNDFIQAENTLVERLTTGSICRDENGNPCLECTCGMVIGGKSKSASPLFTEGGSIWTNNASESGLTADQDPRNNPRNRCTHYGYESVALIPIHHSDNIVGLLQLNDRKKDRFTPIMVQFFESIGEIIGLAMMRKQSDDEIHELNENLENRIAERTLQLENTNKELAVRMDVIEQFTYIASHDLQEPLRTFTNFAQLIREDYADKLDADGNKYIDFIYNAADRMRELVSGLVDFAILGKESILTSVDCNKIVNEVLFDLGNAIKDCDAKITVHELPVLQGYATELRLLFQNLLNNAIKFRKKDAAPEINISVEGGLKEWLFKIEDNGIGIDAKSQDKIFVIFKRMHNRSDYKGAGIGLAHCKKIVELHGGKIWVESTPGRGSIFLFTIPKK